MCCHFQRMFSDQVGPSGVYFAWFPFYLFLIYNCFYRYFITLTTEPSTHMSVCCLQMLNQSLLANRRYLCQLHLHLLVANLQGASVLHQRWEDCVEQWRSSRIQQIIQHFKWVL
ncbi:hypothetical protein NL108_004917 [Boleophthalmus pectinirostris]|nr:hypothetical protein NL108_004917 [Boleophthalmus pectinirostris]